MANTCLLAAVAGLFLLCQPLTSSAQNWGFSFAAGPGFTSLKGNAQFSSQHKTTLGYSMGFSGEYFLNKTFSVVANPAYERKGSVSEFRVNSNTSIPFGVITVRNRFDYVTLPVLLRAIVGHPVAFFANVGPYYSFLVKQENTTPEDAAILIQEDKAAASDFGISGGLGMLFRLNTSTGLQFELRKNKGLANINASDEVDGSVYTDAVYFTVGLVFVPGGFSEE